MQNYFEQTRHFWRSAVLRGNLVFPNEHVVRVVKRYLNAHADKGNSLTVLDFGCGLGRDSLAIANYGVNVIAMDYNEELLQVVKERCAGTDLKIKCVRNEGLEVPVEAQSIDIIIADGSLFYYSTTETIRLLKNLQRCLKSGGGVFWASWRTKKDSLFKEAVPLSDGLYEFKADSSSERCNYFFTDENDLRRMYDEAGFKVQSIDLAEYTDNNMAILNSWYHVIAAK